MLVLFSCREKKLCFRKTVRSRRISHAWFGMHSFFVVFRSHLVQGKIMSTNPKKACAAEDCENLLKHQSYEFCGLHKYACARCEVRCGRKFCTQCWPKVADVTCPICLKEKDPEFRHCKVCAFAKYWHECKCGKKTRLWPHCVRCRSPADAELDVCDGCGVACDWRQDGRHKCPKCRPLVSFCVCGWTRDYNSRWCDRCVQVPEQDWLPCGTCGEHGPRGFCSKHNDGGKKCTTPWCSEGIPQEAPYELCSKCYAELRRFPPCASFGCKGVVGFPGERFCRVCSMPSVWPQVEVVEPKCFDCPASMVYGCEGRCAACYDRMFNQEEGGPAYEVRCLDCKAAKADECKCQWEPCNSQEEDEDNAAADRAAHQAEALCECGKPTNGRPVCLECAYAFYENANV